MPDRGRVAAALIRVAALLLPALLALRLPSALDGQDAVHFAAGLEDFDPALERPHFPGYPLYIVWCRIAAATGVPEAQALALPGVILSAALIPSMVALGRAAGVAEATLALAALLLAAQPLLWLEGPRAAPDLFGASLAWLALGLAARARSFAGGVALGLGLGVRVDLAPMLAGVVALESTARSRFLAGVAVGVLVWLPAFLLVLPPGGIAGAIHFAEGHFLVWGSSALAGAGGGEAWRGLAFAVGGPLFAFASAWGATLAPIRLRRGLGAALVPYALWVLVGQNLASPRHLLPLAPALALGAALAIGALQPPPRRVLVLALVLASLWITGRVARTPHPDGRELAARVETLCADCAAVFGGSEVFLLQRYGVAGPLLYRRESVAQVRRDLAAWPELEGPIGITSSLADSAQLPGQGSKVGDGLRLYRLDASALRFAR